MMRAASLVMLGAGLAVPPASAQLAAAPPLSSIGDSRAPSVRAHVAPAPRPAAMPQPARAGFGGEIASADVHRVADWVAASGDNRGLPFIIVDKVEARAFLFDARSRIRGAAPVLLGIGRGDDSIAGIGQRRLATMRPEERTTPAGRFEASLGHDLDQDVLWVDYNSALSMHRVIIGKPEERRRQRLETATPLDNRISYGCINVPAAFYDKVIVPAFTATVGIVYILPESKSVAESFGIPAASLADGWEQPAR